MTDKDKIAIQRALILLNNMRCNRGVFKYLPESMQAEYEETTTGLSDILGREVAAKVLTRNTRPKRFVGDGIA